MNTTARGREPWPVLLALVAVWGLVLPESAAPFQGGKALLLPLAAALALAHLLPRGKDLIRQQDTRLLALLLALLALTTALSPARWVALWGNDYREMGALVWGSAFVLAWAWPRLGGTPRALGMALSVGSGLAVGVLVWARAMPPEVGLAPLAPALQSGGTTGNAAFLAVALAGVVPFLLGLAATPGRGRERALFAVAAAWSLAGIVITGSRGGLLGLGVAALVVGLLRLPRPWRWLWGLGGTFLPSAAIIWAATHPHTWAWDFLHRNGTLVQRLIVWQATLDLLRRHPLQALLGFGADTMGLFFPEVYPAVLVGYEPDLQAHVFDRAHNLLLDLWVQFGLIPVLIAVILTLRAWRRTKRPRKPSPPWRDGALAGVMALLANWAVHFPTPTTLLLALMLSQTRAGEDTSAAGDDPLPALWGIGLGLVALFALPEPGGRVLLVGLALLGAGASLFLNRSLSVVEPLLVPTVVVGALLVAFPTTPGLPTVAAVALITAGWAWYARPPVRWPALAVVIVGLVLVVPPLMSDAWAGSGERALARGDVTRAVTLGERAWRLFPRERVTFLMARGYAVMEGMPMAARVEQALTWLDRAPQPHSAGWWHVRLAVLRRGVEAGVVPRARWEKALAGARAYFPGNPAWR